MTIPTFTITTLKNCPDECTTNFAFDTCDTNISELQDIVQQLQKDIEQLQIEVEGLNEYEVERRERWPEKWQVAWETRWHESSIFFSITAFYNYLKSWFL